MHLDGNSGKIFGCGTRLTLLAAVSIALASCVSSTPKVSVVKKSKPTEYFAESLVGVKASPRVVNVAMATSPSGHMKRLPRGGGRDMVGKPYKVRGKWYYPKEIENYKSTGTASWYGDAFHGRLTANGEIYDMNHLSAAHPTMPLPSYARVTNIKNGKSIIVRVNDRGPYAHNRMIDLSKRAAQLLDYTKSGTAQVQMEYIGRAPVHGKDDEYLLASFQDGNGATGSDVMLAMNEPAPPAPGTVAAVPTVAFAPDAQPSPAQVNQPQPTLNTSDAEGFVLEESGIRGTMPEAAPVLVDRPNDCVTLEPCDNSSGSAFINGYAQIEPSRSDAFSALGLDDTSSWKQDTSGERILIGAFTPKKADLMKIKLKKFAHLAIENSGDKVVEVYAKPVKGLSMDDLVRKLWNSGYTEAFVVR